MIELLAPAGSPEALDAAIAEGADAVYLGLKCFNARMRSANFAYSQFEGALRSLRRMGRRVYVTVNTVFEQREADRVYQLLKYLADAGPDGIIVQDFGILVMAKEFPRLTVHASTQMNIASARGANALSKYGVSRVVLARELSLEEIKSIRMNTNVELEVFVHGALCVSASGLCLFSSYLGGKSANRGLCTQACRRLYHPVLPDGTEETLGYSGAESGLNAHRRGDSGKPEEFESRGETSPLKKGYYFSPCDLCLINRVPELAEAGVRSLKIEGRMKSAEYVGAVVSAYRRVLDSLESGEDERRRAVEDAQFILRNDFARPKTEFFFNTTRGEKQINTVLRPEQDGGTGISLGTIRKLSGRSGETGAKRALIKSSRFADDCPVGRIRLSAGDSLRFHKADDSRRQAHKLSCANSADKDAYFISVPAGFGVGDAVYLIQTKSMTKRYPQVIPKDLSSFKRQPGRERAPMLPDLIPNKQVLPLGEGIFAQVASVEDLYIVQSIRPAGVILPLNRKTVRSLLEEKTLPFKPVEIILALDPWFPQEDEAFLAELPDQLEERGYHSYILNNPGHFSLFRGKKPNLLITGPWLYTFNGWAAAFTAALGAKAFITPLENNRQNLEKTIPPPLRQMVFVTLFAWPPLFRIKTGSGGLYKFKRFTGNENKEFFSLINGDGSSTVIPDAPFCIIDKRPFLLEAGFRRFILDFSGGTFTGSFPLKKKLYKEVMKAAQESRLCGPKTLTPAGMSRFNWKDGFFNNEPPQKNS